MKLSRLTIRARITGGSLVIAVLISVIAGILIYSQVQRIVSDAQVAVLESVEATYLTALTASHEEVDPPGAGQLVAIVDPVGDARLNTLPTHLAVMLGTLAREGGITRSILVNGSSYLVRVTDVRAASGTWHVISAVDDRTQQSGLHQVAFLLIATIAGINLAFGGASWLIGSAALSPVGRLRRSAADLVSKPGTELLPVGPANDEIAELSRTLNELIGQLRTSAERERQVVSDASHELRRPLTILQTQLELAQSGAKSVDQLRSDVSAAQHTLTRLIALANSTLDLSRIDSQTVPGSASVDELSVELGEAADRGRRRVAGRDVRIDYSGIEGDARRIAIAAVDFGRICDNLVNNALAVTEGPGAVGLTLSSRSGGVLLRVGDDFGGMPTEFVPHAFDRFSRADTSRAHPGAGLGLAIVRGIAQLAGGTVILDNRAGDGLNVEVSLPLSREA
ncbi:ATP-binding protein [soil metagenome]